jgi:hypothetical protein
LLTASNRGCRPCVALDGFGSFRTRFSILLLRLGKKLLRGLFGCALDLCLCGRLYIVVVTAAIAEVGLYFGRAAKPHESAEGPGSAARRRRAEPAVVGRVRGQNAHAPPAGLAAARGFALRANRRRLQPSLHAPFPLAFALALSRRPSPIMPPAHGCALVRARAPARTQEYA